MFWSSLKGSKNHVRIHSLHLYGCVSYNQGIMESTDGGRNDGGADSLLSTQWSVKKSIDDCNQHVRDTASQASEKRCSLPIQEQAAFSALLARRMKASLHWTQMYFMHLILDKSDLDLDENHKRSSTFIFNCWTSNPLAPAACGPLQRHASGSYPNQSR